MVALSVLALALGFLAALVLPNLVRFVEVDRCLDGGGRYNYESDECTSPSANEVR